MGESNHLRGSDPKGDDCKAQRAEVYLEGQGDLVIGLIMGMTRVTIWVIGVIHLLTKSP